MKHLRESEFVDAIEGTLPPEGAAHLETCVLCRAQVDAIGGILREAEAADVPEPSPLFWDRLSARVRDRVADQAPGGQRIWDWAGIRALMPLAAAVAILIAVGSAALLPRALHDVSAPEVLAPPVTNVADNEPAIDQKNLEVWDVLTSAASELEIDDAHEAGMGIRPAAVDRAVQRLNQDELTELERLLQSELKHSGN
jgi:hypothetical protein